VLLRGEALRIVQCVWSSVRRGSVVGGEIMGRVVTRSVVNPNQPFNQAESRCDHIRSLVALPRLAEWVKRG
jgi:hypothetical protein